MRVLVVEDEVRLANNIAEALRERCGFAVDCAEDGTDGAAMTEFKHYDLLLLDSCCPVSMASASCARCAAAKT